MGFKSNQNTGFSFATKTDICNCVVSASVYILYMLLCLPRFGPKGDLYQESVALPYWPFSSNDFWSYVEYFRTLGAYDRIDELARAFFAQFPFGSHLGYHVPNHEH
uniref:Otospiralin n=1 Tax=Buteo japonicus TaxID=224669 RepID=A0A8C0BF80_9AVES